MSEEIQDSDDRLPSLSIPESAYKPFRDIISMDDDSFSRLAQTLSAALPKSSPDRFAEQISKGFPASRADSISAIVVELFRMNYVQSETSLPPQEVANLITDAVNSNRHDETEFKERELAILQKRLATLLQSHQALFLTSKANLMLMEHQHLFYSAQLFTDMRPVFSPDASSVDAAVIIHNLSIHYGAGEGHKQFHVVLDDSDIETLRDILDRAEEKSFTLRKLIKVAGTTFLPTDT